MTIHLNTQADLEGAIHALVEQDPRLKPIFKLAGMPALRRREPGYAGLAAIVASKYRPRAPRRSGPASAPRSTRFTMTRCAAPAPTVWAGSDCRRRRSRP